MRWTPDVATDLRYRSNVEMRNDSIVTAVNHQMGKKTHNRQKLYILHLWSVKVLGAGALSFNNYRVGRGSEKVG